MTRHRARRRVAQLGDAAAAAVPPARPHPALPRAAHDAVLDAASGTTGALVIGDAGFAAAARFPHAVDLGAAWRDTTGLPFVYAVWTGRPGAVGPDDIAILQQSLADGLAARATIARAWSEAHGGDPARLPALPDRQHPLPAGRRGAVRAGGVLRPRARGGAAAARRPAAAVRDAARIAVSVPGTAGAPSRSIDALLADAAGGERLTPEEALRLYADAPVLELGAAADARRQALHPDGEVTYIIDRNVNYTNVCVTRCKFCNFYRPPDQQDRGLRAVARGARRRSSRRPSTWAACRSCCRAA